jgi:hypothetical protein
MTLDTRFPLKRLRFNPRFVRVGAKKGKTMAFAVTIETGGRNLNRRWLKSRDGERNRDWAARWTAAISIAKRFLILRSGQAVSAILPFLALSTRNQCSACAQRSERRVAQSKFDHPYCNFPL